MKIFDRLDKRQEELKLSGFTMAETSLEDMLLILNHVRNRFWLFWTG